MSARAAEQRSEERVTHGIGHRREQLRLGALQREEREIGGDDDEASRRRSAGRPGPASAHLALVDHSSCGRASRRRRIASDMTMAPSTMMPKSMAPSDRRLAGISVRCMAMKTATSASGMRHRHHHRAPRAAEEQDQHDADEADAFHDGVRDLAHGGLHEHVAVDVGHDTHTFGRKAPVELIDLGVDALQHLGRVLVFQQLDDTLDRIGIGVLAEDALALLMAVAQNAEIAHQDRDAVSLRDDDVAEILERADEADAADDVALLAAGDAAAAGIGAVVVDGGDDVVEADAVAQELGRIEHQLVLHGEAAEIRDLDHARHLLAGRGRRSSAGSQTAPSGSWCRIRACSDRSRRQGRSPRRARAAPLAAASPR